jgi:anhydro-N-acetylmuramic acid kinase
MSGTSRDGIDAALVKILGSGGDTRIELIKFICVPYEDGIREGLEALTPQCSVAEISKLNFLIGDAFANAALRVIDESGTDRKLVDLIGSHGQTVYHNPPSRNDGIPSTLQLGELDVIAEATGVTTVGDFRTRDIAAGGEGAPLLPYADYYCSEARRVRIQNMGGIANATVITESLEDVTAFDTGLGKYAHGQGRRASLQVDGSNSIKTANASRGKAMKNSLTSSWPTLISRNLPKSTGEELFGKERAETRHPCKREISLDDLMATLIELTVKSISFSYERFIFPIPNWRIIFSGGGCRNPVLMDRLRN